MSAKPMFTLREALPWLSGAHLIGDGDVPVLRVHTDTRSLLAGDLFVALPGERFDGNAFLSQARHAGAVAALCNDAAALRAAGLPGIVVADTRRALGMLAAAWRARHRLPLIAVTGSNGKTTVTQMTASILRAHKPSNVLATEGNFNNDIGVPLTLLRLRAHHELAVIELGMNHPGEIRQLASIARPTVALVNNAQREHQEFMSSVEAVARENGTVIEALDAGGTAVYPADDAYSSIWRQLAGTRPRITFAFDQSAGAQVYCERAERLHDAWDIHAHTPAGPLKYQLRAAGLHNVRNSLAAASCAMAAGVSLAAIAKGLAAFEPVAGRMHSMRLALAGRTLNLVDDTYNANPDSVRAAIDVLAALPSPRLLVLGDMGEVGDQGPAYHAEIGAYAAERGVDHLHALGELTRHSADAFKGARHFVTFEELEAAVQNMLPQLQSVLVKGSRFMRMERIVRAVEETVRRKKEESHAA